jgi:hypothetical protein
MRLFDRDRDRAAAGPATGFGVIRIDPRTLRRTLVIHVS